MRKISDYSLCHALNGESPKITDLLKKGWELYGFPFESDGCIRQVLIKYEEEVCSESVTPELTYPPGETIACKGSNTMYLAPIDYKPKSFLWWQKNTPDNRPNYNVEVLVKLKNRPLNLFNHELDRWDNSDWTMNLDDSIEKWAYIPE